MTGIWIKKNDDFVDSISRTEEGIAEVEDFVNIDDVDVHIHKRLLEMAPDIFTSLGILGTFIGLVWGLKNFQPTDYEVMTNFCICSCRWYKKLPFLLLSMVSHFRLCIHLV